MNIHQYNNNECQVMKTGSVKFSNAIWDEIREIKLYGTFQNDLYF